MLCTTSAFLTVPDTLARWQLSDWSLICGSFGWLLLASAIFVGGWEGLLGPSKSHIAQIVIHSRPQRVTSIMSQAVTLNGNYVALPLVSCDLGQSLRAPDNEWSPSSFHELSIANWLGQRSVCSMGYTAEVSHALAWISTTSRHQTANSWAPHLQLGWTALVLSWASPVWIWCILLCLCMTVWRSYWDSKDLSGRDTSVKYKLLNGAVTEMKDRGQTSTDGPLFSERYSLYTFT